MEKYLKLIQNKSRWVYSKNATFNRSLNITQEDCDASAVIGFCKAMKNVDPKKCKGLGKYIVNYIRQENRNEINNLYGHRRRRASQEFLDATVKSSEFPKRSKSMYFINILNSFKHIINDHERELLQMRYCDGLSAFKVGKRLGIPLMDIEKSVRTVGKKIKKEILKYGPVRRKLGVLMGDIESNLIKAHAEYLRKEFIEKEEMERDNDY